jgi:hypothetical protein
MNSYDVTYQLIDSPIDESKPGGTIAADRLIEAFQGFPFAEEVKKAETMKDGAAHVPDNHIQEKERWRRDRHLDGQCESV